MNETQFLAGETGSVIMGFLAVIGFALTVIAIRHSDEGELKERLRKSILRELENHKKSAPVSGVRVNLK